MRPIVYLFAILVGAGFWLSGCDTGIFSEEVPGYPTFGADVEQVDFGRVIMHEETRQFVTVRNVGALDSKLYLYYYVEGDESFHLITPEQEITLTRGKNDYQIIVGVTPQRTGELAGNLVIYHSFRPLPDDLDVTTYKIPLSGYGLKDCNFPGMPIPDLRPARSAVNRTDG